MLVLVSQGHSGVEGCSGGQGSRRPRRRLSARSWSWKYVRRAWSEIRGQRRDRLPALVELLPGGRPEARVDAEVLVERTECLVAGPAGPAGTRTQDVRGERREPRREMLLVASPLQVRERGHRGGGAVPLRRLDQVLAQRRLEWALLQPVVGAEPPVRHGPDHRVAQQGQDQGVVAEDPARSFRGLGDLDVAGALLAEEALVSCVPEVRPVVPVPALLHARRRGTPSAPAGPAAPS